MKRLLLILTLLIPTTVMGEVLEVNCVLTLNGGESVTPYRFDLDKKIATKLLRDSESNEVFIHGTYPLEVFESYLLWFVKYGSRHKDEPAVFVHMLNRETGKLDIGWVDSSNPAKAGADKQQDCTRRI